MSRWDFCHAVYAPSIVQMCHPFVAYYAFAMRLLCERIARAMRLHAEKKRKEPKEKKRDEEEYYIYNIIIYNTILLI